MHKPAASAGPARGLLRAVGLPPQQPRQLGDGGGDAAALVAGEDVAKQYQDAGPDMMHEHATFEDGGVSVEAGVQEMHDRMRGGRWKVLRDQNDE